VVIEVEFLDDRNLSFTVHPQPEGEEIQVKGEYSVKYGTLKSPAIYKGEPVALWIGQDDLIIHASPESPRRFHRQIPAHALPTK
jgi:hypothetical protein